MENVLLVLVSSDADYLFLLECFACSDMFSKNKLKQIKKVRQELAERIKRHDHANKGCRCSSAQPFESLRHIPLEKKQY